MSSEITPNIMRVREYRAALPFKPFRVRIADGREFPVNAPYSVAISPGGGEICWAGGPLGFERVKAAKILEVVRDA